MNNRSSHRPDLKPGVLVRSRYAAGWFARIIEVEKRKDTSPLVTVETLCTADGRPHRKPYRKRYDAGWLVIVDELPERYASLLLEQERAKADHRRHMQIRKR